MLLEHTGTEYKEKQYKCGPAPDFDKSCWFEIKETLGFDFPNLPYMIDGTYIIYYRVTSLGQLSLGVNKQCQSSMKKAIKLF